MPGSRLRADGGASGMHTSPPPPPLAAPAAVRDFLAGLARPRPPRALPGAPPGAAPSAASAAAAAICSSCGPLGPADAGPVLAPDIAVVRNACAALTRSSAGHSVVQEPRLTQPVQLLGGAKPLGMRPTRPLTLLCDSHAVA
jgi:hypothetical protein